MGKLKEKMLNNNNEEDNQFELSAFEYVELMSKYKDSVQEEYVPTEEDMKKLDEMLAEYYNSKEFREYVENYQPNDESLQELEDDGQPYESIEEIWPDYPTKEDFFFNEDEY